MLIVYTKNEHNLSKVIFYLKHTDIFIQTFEMRVAFIIFDSFGTFAMIFSWAPEGNSAGSLFSIPKWRIRQRLQRIPGK